MLKLVVIHRIWKDQSRMANINHEHKIDREF